MIRQDMACGSTIGPISSAKLGIPTVDLGQPLLSMHSIREMVDTTSVYQSIVLFKVRILICWADKNEVFHFAVYKKFRTYNLEVKQWTEFAHMIP